MFKLFRQKPQQPTTKAVFKIEGMHCTSCAMNIDGTLEELAGVTEASTSYSKSETSVHYDAAKLSREDLIKAIESTGYNVVK